MSILDIAPPYHVQSTATTLRSGFPYFAFHDSVTALWSQKWRALCARSIYPFTDGNVDDFDPVFAQLVAAAEHDPDLLLHPDDYAAPFLPVGQRLVAEGDDAAKNGRSAEAKDRYLRGAAVYRMARFPIIRSPLGQEAWTKGKAAYEQAGLLLDPPSVAVDIPFTEADTTQGDLDVPIQAYLRVPKGERPENGWPVILFICGLDAYRTDHTPRTQAHVDQGCATMSIEIPGTGDCPAAPNDPTSPDRVMSSVLDWMVAHAAEHGFDPARIIARGISTGGYYAFRIAHTHADRLFAAVAQGGSAHHVFDPAWIGAQNQMEYPFALADALAYKFGFRDADPSVALARYTAEAGRFSLVSSGVLDTPTCKMFIINGMEDSIFPVEDSIIVATQTDKADLVLRGGRGHMGNPGAEPIVMEWIADALAGKP